MKYKIIIEGDYTESENYLIDCINEEDYNEKVALCIDDYVESCFDPSIFDDDYDAEEFVSSCKVIYKEKVEE